MSTSNVQRSFLVLLLLPVLTISLFVSPSSASESLLEGKTISVVTILQEPYVMRVSDGDSTSYRGFYIDLLNLLQRELKFRYRIYVVADGRFGSQNEAGGSWNGLIGDILNKRANVTLAYLRLSPSRLEAVDFTVPLMTSSLGMLFKEAPLSSQRQAADSSASLLAQPFATSTWLLLVLMYILYMGLTSFILLMSPYELGCSLSSVTLPKAQKAGCSAFAFVTGGLFIQGSARTPKAPSARIMTFAWWLFALATACCYTAGLVPRLMPSSSVTTYRYFSSLRELLGQDEVPFGMMKYGDATNLIKSSGHRELRALAYYLQANPQNYVEHPRDNAVERVRKGSYVWIEEGDAVDYAASKHGDLVSVSTGISATDFGLAIAKGSSLKQPFDAAIIKLKTTGELNEARARWFDKIVGDCRPQSSPSSPRSLQPGSLLCLYLLLLIFGVASIAVLPVEHWFKARGRPSQSATENPEKAAASPDVPKEPAQAELLTTPAV